MLSSVWASIHERAAGLATPVSVSAQALLANRSRSYEMETVLLSRLVAVLRDAVASLVSRGGGEGGLFF